MSNADVFQFIKILVLNEAQEAPTLEEFKLAMDNNYYLEKIHEHHHLFDNDSDEDQEDIETAEKIIKAAALCNWVDRSVDLIDDLPIGTMFKGITKDSLMYSYQVVAKTQDGKKSIWYPVSDECVPIAVVAKFDWDTKDYETIFADDYFKALDMLTVIAEPGNFYRITDIKLNPVDIFEDEDDESDDGIYYCSEDSDGDLNFNGIKSIFEAMDLTLKFKADYGKLVEKLKERGSEEDSDSDSEHYDQPEEIESQVKSKEENEESSKSDETWVL